VRSPGLPPEAPHGVGAVTEGEAKILLEAVQGKEIGEAEAQGAIALLAELE
jgi:hypothetical protein